MVARIGSRCLSVVRVRAAWFGVLAAFGMALAHPVALRAQDAGGWKADWSVKCTWFHRQLLEKTLEVLDKKFADLLPDGAPEWIVDALCSDEDFELEAGFSRTEFRAASHWLSGLGFPPPIVNSAPDKRKYLAWIDEHLFTSTVRTTWSGQAAIDPNGVYFPSGEIYVSPPMVRLRQAVEPHELFHGVQKAAAPQVWNMLLEDVWLWEGTARAVDLAWGAKLNTLANTTRTDLRYFDHPLNWTPSWDYRMPAYGTSIFWLDVGRQLRAADRVAYLRDLLSRLPSARSSLEAVDLVLSDLFRARGTDQVGLYQAYPEFVRYRLANPDSARVQFNHPATLVLALGGVEEVTFPDDVEPLAAKAYTIRVQVPAGVLAGLRIEFEPDEPNLHLIVDRQRLNRYPTSARPDRQRNLFITSIEGSGQDTAFYVRVANVDRPATATRRQNFKVKLTLKELRRCDSDLMMQALHPRARELMPALLPADQYEARFEADPGLHPGPGWMWITGLVSGRGDACAEPLGSNPALGFQMGEKDAGDRFRRAVERMMSLSPEELKQALASASSESRATMMQQLLGLTSEDARQASSMIMEAMGRDSDALISISTPDGMAWQLGTPAHTFANQRLLKHSGVGGWGPNTGAGVTIRLPGVPPSRLKEDTTYAAELVTAMTSVGTQIYSRWSGQEITVRCEGVETTLLEGSTEWVTAMSMKGNVTITRITGAAVEGRFELRGPGRLEKEEFRRSERGGCISVESSGPQIRTGELGIAGTFTAPAVATAQRFGRGVALTHRFLPDQEDNGDVIPQLAVYPPGLEDTDINKNWCLQSVRNKAICACALVTAVQLLRTQEIEAALVACICLIPGSSMLKVCADPTPGGLELPDPVDLPDRVDIPPKKPCADPAGCPSPEKEEPCPDPSDCPPPKKKEQRCTDPSDCPLPKEEELCPDCPPPGKDPDPTLTPGRVPPAAEAPSDPPGRNPAERPPPGRGAGSSGGASPPGSLFLAFDEGTGRDLGSSLQPVKGVQPAAAGGVDLRGDAYTLRLSLSPDDVSTCRMPGMLGSMLVAGQDLTASVELKLNAARDRIELTVTNSRGQGQFRFEAGGPAGGSVHAVESPGGSIRVQVQSGRFVLSGQGVNVSCGGVGDFVATIASGQ